MRAGFDERRAVLWGVEAKSVLKGVARILRTFSIEVGPIRATGAPAMLVALTGVIVGVGVATALTRASSQLPESLREAKGLINRLRNDDPAFLNP